MLVFGLDHTLTIAFKVWTAGQVIGLIHDIPTCAVLLDRIEKEAQEAMKRSQSLYIDAPTSKL